MRKFLPILFLFLIGCAATEELQTKEYLTLCLKRDNYTLETNGSIYRILAPVTKNVLGYYETREQAEDKIAEYQWRAQVLLWQIEENWKEVR